MVEEEGGKCGFRYIDLMTSLALGQVPRTAAANAEAGLIGWTSLGFWDNETQRKSITATYYLYYYLEA